jgi:hypothetical protein
VYTWLVITALPYYTHMRLLNEQSSALAQQRRRRRRADATALTPPRRCAVAAPSPLSHRRRNCRTHTALPQLSTALAMLVSRGAGLTLARALWQKVKQLFVCISFRLHSTHTHRQLCVVP